MRPAYLASSVQVLLLSFRPAFSQPSFENFVAFIAGWIVNQGPATVSRALVSARALGLLVDRHHSSFYRFLARARWAVDDLGRVLFQGLLGFLPERIEALCVAARPVLHSGSSRRQLRALLAGLLAVRESTAIAARLTRGR